MTDRSKISAINAFSTCDVADALSKLGHVNGGFLDGLALWSPKYRDGDTKLIGPAYTVKYVRYSSMNMNAPKLPHYIDSIPPGSVVFISSPPDVVNSVYGGLMSTRAKVSGAAGTVVDGRIRDLQEHRALGFPVFARDVGTTAFHGTLCVESINKPVRLQTVKQEAVINPGDIIMGDLNGVLSIPPDLVDEILAILPQQVEADELIKKDLLAGRSFSDASKQHRERIVAR